MHFERLLIPKTDMWLLRLAESALAESVEVGRWRLHAESCGCGGARSGDASAPMAIPLARGR